VEGRRWTEAREVQPQKAEPPMEAMEAGRVTEVRCSHP
jgi:hypothetical protein